MPRPWPALLAASLLAACGQGIWQSGSSDSMGHDGLPEHDEAGEEMYVPPGESAGGVDLEGAWRAAFQGAWCGLVADCDAGISASECTAELEAWFAEVSCDYDQDLGEVCLEQVDEASCAAVYDGAGIPACLNLLDTCR